MNPHPNPNTNPFPFPTPTPTPTPTLTLTLTLTPGHRAPMSTCTWRGPRRAWATSTAWQRASKVARVGVEIRAAFGLSRLDRGLAARLPTLLINPFGLSRLERRGLPSLPARGGAAAGDTDTITLPVPESFPPSLLPECLTTFERLHAPTTTPPPTPPSPPLLLAGGSARAGRGAVHTRAVAPHHVQDGRPEGRG